MSDALIEIRGLKKTYRMGDIDVHALRGVDLTVERGEFIAVCGPSGSGKSTLFYILGGLTQATGGQVLIDGRDLTRMNDSQRTAIRRELVGFVFQRYNLLPTLSAADNIAMARYIAGSSKFRSKQDTEWFRQTLELLGVAHRLHHKPRSLSGGEQQRVAIARAIVNHPVLLLADEPTGNLDTENSETVLKLLVDLNERLGQTILMITHNPEAAAYAHRIVNMRDGRIV
ncbi:MAG: ABC transporter ATP-binding protein [Bryobacteraceae bacterium]|nr:ABC transporter ATP-binding protein [Bryobacteraceae bacterium]MDW8380401.1 ABC transporter ATP-binding protein [Bryobacterales bacterium]